MAQLRPPTLIVSCFSKIQIGFTLLVLAHPGSPGQRAVKRVCVCVSLLYVFMIVSSYFSFAGSGVYFTFCTIAILTSLNSLACSFVTCFSTSTQ